MRIQYYYDVQNILRSETTPWKLSVHSLADDSQASRCFDAAELINFAYNSVCHNSRSPLVVRRLFLRGINQPSLEKGGRNFVTTLPK